MMDIRKILGLIILSLHGLTSSAQFDKSELKVGDKIPDLIVKNIINKHGSEVNINDLYKDGLLIIDFWATWCKPCIQEMKFLDSLKGGNKTKFNVIMVTSEDSSVVDKFLSRPSNSEIKTSNLYLGSNDKILHALFPHRTVPHNIWIDKNGVIKAITSGSEITSYNILNFGESGTNNQMKTKVDNLTFDPFKEFHLGDSIYTYRSIITPNIPGISGGVLGGIIGGKSQRIFFQYNGSITHLFWNAYSNSKPWRDNLIQVLTTDSLKFFYPIGNKKGLLKGSKYSSFENWTEENTYCYALTLPKPVPDSIFREYLLNDLQRQFNVRVDIVKKKMDCEVVTKIPSLKKMKMANRSSIPHIEFIPGFKMKITNCNLDAILDWWWMINDETNQPRPFIIEVPGSDQNYFSDELDFSGEPNVEDTGFTYAMFVKVLEQYGYRFNREFRSYPTLVLTDKDDSVKAR